VTVVIVVTMVFAPVFKHNHWLYRLVSQKQTTHSVRCVAGSTAKTCPARKQVVRRVYRPLPKNALARCKGHRPCLPRKQVPARTQAAKQKPIAKTRK
jgi:hypothetical protein